MEFYTEFHGEMKNEKKREKKEEQEEKNEKKNVKRGDEIYFSMVLRGLFFSSSVFLRGFYFLFPCVLCASVRNFLEM